jgi:hypothetical protein
MILWKYFETMLLPSQLGALWSFTSPLDQRTSRPLPFIHFLRSKQDSEGYTSREKTIEARLVEAGVDNHTRLLFLAAGGEDTRD